jgi:hypothetical protein
MSNTHLFYADIDGDIDTILISPSIRQLTCKDGSKFFLDDITEDGELYKDHHWSQYFEKECDILFLRYMYALLDSMDLNDYIFPSA